MLSTEFNVHFIQSKMYFLIQSKIPIILPVERYHLGEALFEFITYALNSL